MSRSRDASANSTHVGILKSSMVTGESVDAKDQYGSARGWLHAGFGLRLKGLLPLLPHYLAFSLMHVVLSPFLALRGLERAKRRGYDGIVLERLFGGSQPPEAGTWTVVFASGMGEARSAIKVAEDIADKRHRKVAVLMQRNSGRNLAEPRVLLGVAPFHNPISVLLFLLRWRPRDMLFTEFCDNQHLSFTARLLGIRTVVYNVQISEEETLRAIRKLQGWRWRTIGAYAVLSDVYRDRLLRIGVHSEQIATSGPITLAIDRAEDPDAIVEKWQRELHLEPGNYPVIVAGSLHASDETVCLEAFCLLRQHYPKAVLVLAPRNLKRQDLTQLLDAKGMGYAKRSDGFDVLPETGIIVLDTYGELKDLYSVATIAFVGGTFEEKFGGHTPVEALSWQVPITVGPLFWQQQVVVDILLKAGIAFVCPDAGCLAQTWMKISDDSSLRHQIATEADKLMKAQENRIIELYDSLGLGGV